MKYKGEITVSDPGADSPILRAGTLQCCHCGKHWVPQPGSGIERGWCSRCHGYICGRGCAKCVPMEKMLEIMEGTADPNSVSVNVPQPWTPESQEP